MGRFLRKFAKKLENKINDAVSQKSARDIFEEKKRESIVFFSLFAWATGSRNACVFYPGARSYPPISCFVIKCSRCHEK